MTYEECFLCGKTTLKCSEEIDYVNLNATVPGSKREVRFVLEHLANCIRTKLIFGGDTNMCQSCFKELSEYDKLMVNLLASQKRLTSRLQKALSPKWKDEEIELEENNIATTTLEDDKMLGNTSEAEIELKVESDNDDELPIAVADVVARDDSEDEDFATEKSSGFSFEAKRRMQQECVTCGETFKNKLLLHHHITETHNTKVFKCKICGVVRKNEENLELHMNTHEGKTEYECRYCPKRFSRTMNTLRHMRKHWDKKEYQCEKCGERFSLDNMLYNHRMRHEAEENPLICSICNQSFKSRKTFNHHQLTHQKHRPRHQCPLCPKSFTERYTLKMHMNTHDATKDSEKNESSETMASGMSDEHSCLICEQQFRSKDLLNTHLKKSHNVVD